MTELMGAKLRADQISDTLRSDQWIMHKIGLAHCRLAPDQLNFDGNNADNTQKISGNGAKVKR